MGHFKRLFPSLLFVISLTGCFGQEAAVRKLQLLQAAHEENLKSLQDLQSRLKEMEIQNGQIKSVLKLMATAIDSQRKAIGKMDQALRITLARPAPQRAKTVPAAKSRRRGR